MIFARFSRSASACRAIARCMFCGRSTCFTSTADTLMPHGIGLVVEDLLQLLVQPIALRQQIVELRLSEHAPQRRLRELRRGVDVVLDLDDRLPRIDHAEVDDRVHLHRDVVARDDVLRRHVVDDRAQADAHDAVDRRGRPGSRPAPSAAGSSLPRRKMTPRSYSRRILIELSR